LSTLYRDAALADAHSPTLQLGVSMLVEGGRIAWIRPADSEEDPGDAEVIDAGGTTIVPGMVDCHSHLTLPGGSHWIERIGDTPEQLLRHAEHNAKLQTHAGVRWARDVGAPVGVDPVDGRERALSLGLRDRWRGHADYPYVRAAGTWVTRAGTLPAGLTAEAEDADELLGLSLEQLDDGADLVKLYLDGPDPDTAPWTANEVRRVVSAAQCRPPRRASSCRARRSYRQDPVGGAGHPVGDCPGCGAGVGRDWQRCLLSREGRGLAREAGRTKRHER